MAEKWHQLISLRKAAGLSQYELARRLNMGRSALGNYEQGDREPDFETVRKIADFFSVSVDYLLGRPQDQEGAASEVPPEWRQMVRLAQTEGYSPDQVLGALRLLSSIRKQHEQKEEREG
jgi:transcriptional regulator with XRE-family HTH domain